MWTGLVVAPVPVHPSVCDFISRLAAISDDLFQFLKNSTVAFSICICVQYLTVLE